MIMLMMDRSNLLESLEERSKFWASALDYSRSAQARSADAPDEFRNKALLDYSSVVPSKEFEGTMTLSYAWYHDQIPPFDVVLTALTELGLAARMAINGIDILNSGSGVSIDDITTDENFTYVATGLSPWRALQGAPPTYEGLVRNISDAAAGQQRTY